MASCSRFSSKQTHALTGGRTRGPSQTHLVLQGGWIAKISSLNTQRRTLKSSRLNPFKPSRILWGQLAYEENNPVKRKRLQSFSQGFSCDKNWILQQACKQRQPENGSCIRIGRFLSKRGPKNHIKGFSLILTVFGWSLVKRHVWHGIAAVMRVKSRPSPQ